MVDETAGGRVTESLPRNQRIQKRRDFLRAYEEGLKSFGRYVVLFTLPNELGHPRVGVTVTRKLGRAVARNRAKRWVREIFRRNRARIGADETSLDLVVNVKPSAADATYLEFAADFERALRKALRPAGQ